MDDVRHEAEQDLDLEAALSWLWVMAADEGPEGQWASEVAEMILSKLDALVGIDVDEPVH